MSNFAPSAPPADWNETPAQISECVICFDPLNAEPCCYLGTSPTTAVCRHTLHSRCASSLIPKTCPICRAQFTTTIQLPNILDDTAKWFRTVDADNNGSLSKAELCEALHAQFPLSLTDSSWNSLWNRFDKDKSGDLSLSEITEPGTGVLAYVLYHFMAASTAPPPSLVQDKRAWFVYFDEDGGGTMCKNEVARAIIKTFGLSSSNTKVAETVEMLDNIWFIFDTDGSGDIDIDEFCAGNGLGDTIIASLSHDN